MSPRAGLAGAPRTSSRINRSALRRCAEVRACLVPGPADLDLGVCLRLGVVDDGADPLAALQPRLQILERNVEVLCEMQRRGTFLHTPELVTGFLRRHPGWHDGREPRSGIPGCPRCGSSGLAALRLAGWRLATRRHWLRR